MNTVVIQEGRDVVWFEEDDIVFVTPHGRWIHLNLYFIFKNEAVRLTLERDRQLIWGR